MRRRPEAPALSAACCLLLLALQAGATQVKQLSLEDLGSTAATVVRGTVAGVRSYWNAERTKIFTEITVDSEQTFKGAASGSLRILQLGGTVDHVRVTVHGALAWTPGEEVVLFLEPYRDHQFVVAGLSQGKFNIVRDPGTGEAFVTRLPVEELELVGKSGAGAALLPIDRTPLSQFIAQALGALPAPAQDWCRVTIIRLHSECPSQRGTSWRAREALFAKGCIVLLFSLPFRQARRLRKTLLYRAP